MKRRGLGLPFVALLGLAAGAARDAPRPVSLDGPEVYKVDWNTRALIGYDIDRDGRTDLAVLNNDRAKIDILYQVRPGERRPAKTRSNRWQPVLEDTRFEKRSIVTGGTMYALAAGDLDGDGRSDLVFTGKRDPLTILYQGKGDDWTRRRVIEIEEPAPWTGSLQVTDLDGDGRHDLVVLAKTRLLVFRQDDRGELNGPDEYTLADEGCYGLVARDLNGDRTIDLMYLLPKSQSAWRVRFQVEGGRFGPERVFRMESPRASLVPLADTTGGSPHFAMVHRRTKLVELVSLVARGAKGDPEEIRLYPRVFANASRGAREPSYALGDLDGDGRQDLAVADARSAQVQVYLQRGDGGFGLATGYPTLPEVRSIAMADIDDDGRDELLLVSTSEGTLGVSEMSGAGRLSYPRPLGISGTPLAVAAGDLGGTGDRLAYLYEDGGERGVAILGPRNPSGERRTPLDGLRTDPSALRILDANQDGRSDLAVFIVQSPMRLLLQDDAGAFVEATRETGYRPGLVDDLPVSALGTGDVDGDGMPEMLIAGEGFARSMRVDPAGQLVVLDQFNARDPGDTVKAAVAADLDADGTAEILLAIEDDESLQVLRRDEQGVYRYLAAAPVGSIDLLGTDVVDLDGDSLPDLLFWGADRFWWIPVGGAGRSVDTLASYESDLDEMVPSNLAVGDLNHDGREEIVVVDSVESRIMEILTSDAGRDWRSTLHFTIFEADPHYQGRTGTNREPRELLIADLTADGKADLALLVHDRVLLYPQR